MSTETSPYLVEHGGSADAPLLLCLHGIGSCADAFAPQAPLAEWCGRRVIAWDAPGYRHSPTPDSPFGLDEWADAAAEVIRSYGENADVLGVSWGGVTATRLTLRYPQLVRRLILADSSVGSGTDPERAEAMRGRVTTMSELGLAEFAASRSPRLLSPNASSELIELAAHMMATSVRLPTYEWACASMADTDHTAALGEIDVPTLVVVGTDDIITPRERSEVLVDGIPGATLAVIESAGHLANQEQPEAFNQVVAEFLGVVDRT